MRYLAVGLFALCLLAGCEEEKITHGDKVEAIWIIENLVQKKVGTPAECKIGEPRSTDRENIWRAPISCELVKYPENNFEKEIVIDKTEEALSVTLLK